MTRTNQLWTERLDTGHLGSYPRHFRRWKLANVKVVFFVFVVILIGICFVHLIPALGRRLLASVASFLYFVFGHHKELGIVDNFDFYFFIIHFSQFCSFFPSSCQSKRSLETRTEKAWIRAFSFFAHFCPAPTCHVTTEYVDTNASQLSGIMPLSTCVCACVCHMMHTLSSGLRSLKMMISTFSR